MSGGMATQSKRSRMPKSIVVAVVVGAMSFAVVACGDEDGPSSNGTDKAFASEMISHHEGAIQMAHLARARAARPEVRRLARRIVKSQRGEIDLLRFIKAELRKNDVPPGELGLSEAQMAKDGDLHMLREAADVDRTFIEMMIPHHRGAIKIAAVELRNGRDSRSKDVARSIIDTQQREIKQLERWLADWYGGEPEPEPESPDEHGR